MTREELYTISSWAYSLGEPIISDAEWNDLRRELGKTDSWSNMLCPTELLLKYDMTNLIEEVRVNFDKTESVESLDTEHSLAMYLSVAQHNEYMLSYKEDGWNVQATYVYGQLKGVQSRGRSATPIQFDNLMEILPKLIPYDKSIVRIIMEATLSESNLDILRMANREKDLQGTRTSIRTALLDKNTVHLINCDAFDIQGYNEPVSNREAIYVLLRSWGFSTPTYSIATSMEEVYTVFDYMNDNHNPMTDPPTDGIVIEPNYANVNQVRMAIRLGRWASQLHHSYVTGYIQEPANKRFNCLLSIFPVNTGGKTQYKLDIDNPARIIENNLEVGSPVVFEMISSAVEKINLNKTLYLQDKYKGRYDEYAKLIGGNMDV